MKTEHVHSFVQAARRSLQCPDIVPRRVLLRRLVEHRTASRHRHPYSSIVVPVQLSASPIFTNDQTPNGQGLKPPIAPVEQASHPADPILNEFKGRKALPTTCPGCGAFSQEADSREPGYYSRSRKAVKSYLRPFTAIAAGGDGAAHPETIHTDQQPDLAQEAETETNDSKDTNPVAMTEIATPVCDRCHDLVHNSRGSSIAHPSLQDLADSIAESPFTRNHVYHVLDAADFPMSLIPSLFNRLELARPRSQNRRSQHSSSYKPSLSFIITRSDLLGPTKDKVDSMMPYLRSVLRTALGRTGERMRLGNVHLVSAKRGWWSKELKESIWERGGGNWMLGKFNVGKSNLFEVLFPKGSGERAPVYAELAKQQSHPLSLETDFLSESSLLPPPQPETPFPALPLVSSLPGTTASPIRLPFGNRKGELIDLPGLERGNLEEYVHPDHKLDLVMTHRPDVDQYSIRPGQSLLLGGGLVRITPVLDESEPSTVMLAYPFVPIEAHVTSTEKAIGMQSQAKESGIKSILAEDAGQIMESAGIISLDVEVTKQRAGVLLRAGVPLSRLPFQVYSTDLLIEGVGWVELVCQVRRRRQNLPASNMSDDTAPEAELPRFNTAFKPFVSQPSFIPNEQAEYPFPHVEVFTPNGKHISQRRPLGAWDLWNAGRRTRQTTKAAARPRKPMKGVKKREKMLQRRNE